MTNKETSIIYKASKFLVEMSNSIEAFQAKIGPSLNSPRNSIDRTMNSEN